MKVVEFYMEKQGRPGSDVALDMETRKPSIPASSVSGVMLQASHSSISETNNYTAAGHTVILVDAGVADVIVSLPEASSHSGRLYYVKKVDTSGHKVTIDGDGDETIDDDATVEITIPYTCLTVLCDGTEWWII